MAGPSEAEALLRRIGESADAEIDLGEAALALAAADRPGVALGRYRDHLDDLAAAAATAFARQRGDGLASRSAALVAALVEEHGYAGDRLTYDDLQNANLMRVIDRRKGLPVALGIVWIATARRLGWDLVGINFPGHFLLRLEHDGRRAILDPFERGRIRAAPELRDLLKAGAGTAAELTPDCFAPVGNRDVLLRLQNNIKLRLLQASDVAGALAVVERMLLIAPGLAELLRESAILNMRAGNLQAAMFRLERYLATEPADHPRHEAARLLQELRRRLN